MRVEDSSSSIDEKSVDVDPYERSNYTILMVIKYIIHESLRDTVAKEATKVRFTLQEIEKRYQKKDRAEISALMNC